ncbi:PREDICTED: uncharacterized protein LOC108568149 [Nicrophorus vespilloides]|uniref:Uncharacterized protein LOC108568149 n=1 Tax=Nicrophorus vespilloides TaxID=110193 RepID=A0ABM1NCM7_NICVS|nr:PREDICTED: uncharacterized protein LOC108568149 [Nicrophorus vespilloides]
MSTTNNTSEALDVFTDKLMLEIEKLRSKIIQGMEYLEPKNLLEIVHTDLEVLMYGVKYEISKMKHNVLEPTENKGNMELNELEKARAIIKLLSLTNKLSEHVQRSLEP